MRTTLVANLLVALALSAPRFAHAADEVTDTAAKKEFSAGEKAFAANDYVAALDHFKKAFTLAPRDAVRFNIGVCLERLGRFKEATDEYEAAAKSNELDETKRERATKEAERVRGRLGTLRVEAASGELFVDGARACDLPCEVALDPQAHRIVIKSGGKERAESVTLKSGQVTKLEIDPGAAEIPKATTPTPPTTPKRDQPTAATHEWPGVLTWVGGGVALAGTAGFIGFGLRARKLEKDYDETPTASTRDEGRTMGTLTNVSLGVAITGVALIAVDLLFISKGKSSSARARSCNGIAF